MIEIVNYKERQKNTLQGFVTIRMTNIGLEIRDITVHQQNGKKWLGMPARPYEKDGKTQYAYIVHFYNEDMKMQFQNAVFIALEQYQSSNKEEEDFVSF